MSRLLQYTIILVFCVGGSPLLNGLFAQESQGIGFDQLAAPMVGTKSLENRPPRLLGPPSPLPLPKGETSNSADSANPEADSDEKPIGALLLKTGFLIEGKAKLEQNLYQVQGKYGRVSVSAHQVEYAGTDIKDVFRYQREKTASSTYDGAYALAKWAAANGLNDEAIAEFERCKTLAAFPPMVKAIDNEIETVRKKEKISRELPRISVGESIPSENEEADSFDYDAWCRSLPSGVFEKFKKDVQPFLVSRCATTDCHHSGSSREFKLLNPQRHHSNTAATARNLKAVLEKLDFEQPASGLLITVPMREHGGTKPLYTKQTKNQFGTVYQWALLVSNTMPDYVKTENRPVEEADSLIVPTENRDALRESPLLRSGGKESPILQVSHREELPVEKKTSPKNLPKESCEPEEASEFSFFSEPLKKPQKINLPQDQPSFDFGENTASPIPTEKSGTEQTEPRSEAERVLERARLLPKHEPIDPFDPAIFNRQNR